MIQEEKMTLATIGEGAAQELFEEQLQRVLKNISDPNTVQTAARSITLKFVFKPDDDREGSAVQIMASSSLAPDKPFPCRVMLANGTEGFEAYEVKKPKQMPLFDQTDTGKVIAMERTE